MAAVAATSPFRDDAAVPRRSVVLGFALAAPLGVAGVLHLAGDRVTSTTSALVLVLVVVAAAAAGVRSAGVVAALGAGAWFDVLLTEPYLSFKVADRDEIEAAVLLLVVGLAVSELALWGRRQQDRASRRAGYLEGVLWTADVVAARGLPPERLALDVARQLVDLLDLDDCRFEPRGARPAASSSVLERDGAVTRRGVALDVRRDGLPTDDRIGLGVSARGDSYGRFVLTASTRVVRPTQEQRRVAVLLADQVAAAFADGRAPGDGTGNGRLSTR